MGFEALVSILAELYPTKADARRIIASASIDHRYVNFDGNALRFWHDIFIVAERQDKVFGLLAATEDEYSDNAEFMRQSRLYFREMAQLAIRANDEHEPVGDKMMNITDRRLDRLEDSVDKITNRQSEIRDRMSEMSGQMTMLLGMVEQMVGERSSQENHTGGSWLLLSAVTIVLLVGVILYILANGGG